MRPGLLHRHRFRWAEISASEERSRGLWTELGVCWYVQRCRCGQESGEPEMHVSTWLRD